MHLSPFLNNDQFLASLASSIPPNPPSLKGIPDIFISGFHAAYLHCQPAIMSDAIIIASFGGSAWFSIGLEIRT